MTLPDGVTASWSAFADAVDVSSLQDADYNRLAFFVVALDGAGLALSDAEEGVLEVGGRDGAPDFLAGELMAGVDVGLRALRAARTAAADAAKAAADAAAAAAAAAAAKTAALSKLSDEEKKALGLA